MESLRHGAAGRNRLILQFKRQRLQLARQFGRLVWPPIPTDAKVSEAAREHRTLWEYAPACRALRGATAPDNVEEGTVKEVGGYFAALSRLVRELGLEVRCG